jgi:hypothetical protein
MGIYAKRPAKMIGQLVGDGFVVLWAIGWAIVAIFVHRVIEVLATPARETARTAIAGKRTGRRPMATARPGRMPVPRARRTPWRRSPRTPWQREPKKRRSSG